MPGDVGRASGQGRELQGQERIEGWVWRGLGFLPAKEGGFFLDYGPGPLWPVEGPRCSRFPAYGSRADMGRQRGSLGELTAPCISRLQSPSCLPPSPGQSSLGGCGLPNRWPLPGLLSPSIGSWGGPALAP